MKNYIIKLSVFLVATLFFMGCNDDFLERYPLDSISEQTFWNSENDLKVYNNHFYDMARYNRNVPILFGHNEGYWSSRASYWFLDEFSDNTVSRASRHTFYQQVRSGRQIVPNTPSWYGYRGWDFVRALNVGLANYNKAKIPQETIDKYAGEARLLRGWFYGEKVEKFGDVPWIGKPLNVDSPELYAPRTPREQAMDSVLADLNFACDHIPADWGDGHAPGRLDKWDALLVKSRICLFEGTWRKYHGGTDPDFWIQQAADAAKEIMDNGPYHLYVTGDTANDYNAYQRILDLTGNPEVMFWQKFKLGTATNHVQSYADGYIGGATKSMVEDYLCSDGLPITLSPLYQGDDSIESVFINRDPRLRQSILYPPDKAKYNYDKGDAYDYPRFPGMTGGRKSETGYIVIKNYNADDMIGHAYNTGESPAIILRYAEVLLNYAEAKAELGTITQDDLDNSINLLRDRVGMPHMDINNIPVDPRYTDDGISPLLVEIRRERRVELFNEGFRYYDLLRWKQGKKLTQPSLGIQWNDAAIARYPGAQIHTKVDPVSGKTYIAPYVGTDWADPVFDENKNYLWPLPLSALSQNDKLKQNPGWE